MPSCTRRTLLATSPALLACLAVVACRPCAGLRQTAIPEWHRAFVGVDYGRVAVEQPRPLRVHVLRINLQAPGIEFLATPPNPSGERHTIGMTTGTFLSRYRLQAAINAAPFGPIYKEEGKPVSVSGLTVSRGRVVSPATDLPALIITRHNEARIAEPPFDLKDVYNAVAGFSVVLRAGEVIGKEDALHPRTAAGISRDGRTLYLMVIDGRQPGYSEGVTTAEVGAWLKVLGAWDGINLDGGGTSTLVVEDARRTPRIMNLPIHDGMPGRQRVGGSHLGLRAHRLPGGPSLPLP
jgi:hypothetical protein